MAISLTARDVGRQCCQSGKRIAVGACGIVVSDLSIGDQCKVVLAALSRAASRALWTAGSKRAIRTAMMAITTSNSMRVNPEPEGDLPVFAVCMLSSRNRDLFRVNDAMWLLEQAEKQAPNVMK